MAYRNPNECEDGGEFGRMNRQGCQYAKIRNAQTSEYAGNLLELDAAILRCREGITAGGSGLSLQARHDFKNLFNLARIGRYYLCVALKETSEILLDADLIKMGDDPWGLGGHSGGAR